MKYLALALLLCALASMSNAHCELKATTPGMTHCWDDADKAWHEMGSSWRNSDCMDCTCDSCCAGYSTPTQFPDDCMLAFDSQACKFRVHKKNNPTVSCQHFGAVGK